MVDSKRYFEVRFCDYSHYIVLAGKFRQGKINHFKMQNPRQAALDYYNVKIAILIIVILTALYLALTVLGTGTKYLLLKGFGVETTAEITNLSQNTEQKANDRFKKEIDVFIKFQDAHSNEHYAIFDAKFENLGNNKYEPPYKPDERVKIIYNSKSPKMVLPTSEFPKFGFDMKLLMISIAVLIVSAFMLDHQIKRYRVFRAQARFY